MEIVGKVAKILEMVTGQGQNGAWRKQEFILETEGDYPKKVCIEIWGDRIDEFKLQEGETVKAHINIASKEANNGRWFTNVRVWKIEREGSQERPPSETDYIDVAPDNQGDDLPF